ncbi:ribosome silencing factor (plasmid) [Qingshengfaniella alkalisoli]|uniref:Ribosomal silencing factor RsfS n=1 Tax=Qingshengfaniella alkalisoli TaxID=2599296 RepID=A0A5B8IAZ2_9RHOB|nr:ribosome silencing factor [Qingshengfaniella alkalisoli]
MSHSAQAVSHDTAPAAPQGGAAPSFTVAELLDHIVTTLSDDKAEDIVKIDLRGRSEMADHMVIASGRSTRQVSALAQQLTDALKQDYGIICKTEGKDQGDWVLIDSGDVIVHIFRPEVRDFYQVEKMWQPAGAKTV